MVYPDQFTQRSPPALVEHRKTAYPEGLLPKML